MEMIPSEYVYDNIISGVTLNFPIYLGPMLGLTTSHTSIIDTGSSANPKWLRDRYTIQIFGRYEKDKYAQGYNDMATIRDAILGKDPETVAEGIWCQFLLLNGPSFIGVSESMHQFSMNFQMTFDADSGTHRQPIQ